MYARLSGKIGAAGEDESVTHGRGGSVGCRTGSYRILKWCVEHVS